MRQQTIGMLIPYNVLPSPESGWHELRSMPFSRYQDLNKNKKYACIKDLYVVFG